jgi:hypothetical protein
MTNDSCCSINKTNKHGCIVCGAELVYSPESTFYAECCLCGKDELTSVTCIKGHYVCNECHSKDILELVEEICIKSELSDPTELALLIFNIPTLHMHGPEYHSIVPAVLVTAYGNCKKSKDPAVIKEAITRGKMIFGGICGTHGACGACIGVGIAYSIIHKVTPFSKEHRGEANKITALALNAISKFEGPRCCKRESITAIEAAKKYLGCFFKSEKGRYICSQHIYNSKCIKYTCPYYPIKRVGVKKCT